MLPECWVAFDGDMRFDQDAFVPGVEVAFLRNFCVAETKISDNLGASGIGGADGGASVKDAIGLIEIYGAGNVCGNDGVLLAFLPDAIDLDGEKNRNTIFL